MTAALLERYRGVKDEIERACAASGREPRSVRLVAVSKGHDAEAIRALYGYGQRLFGESYAQELEDKALRLADLADLEWHFIGHLQTNKAKLVAAHARVIHALDSVRAASSIDRAFASLGRSARALVSVNFGLDDKAHGARGEDIALVRSAIVSSASLTFSGYMTIPPDDERGTEEAFRRLRDIRDEDDPALELSMGMSHDLERAIRFGATYVRIGTSIFGARS